MPTSSAPADPVRQLLSNGETEQAVRLLAQLCKNFPSLSEDAILLESSLNNLEQKVFEGTVSQEDQNIEERRVTKSALRLARLLDQTAAMPPSPASEKIIEQKLAADGPAEIAGQVEKAAEKPIPRRNLAGWALGSLALLGIVWAIWSQRSETPAVSLPKREMKTYIGKVLDQHGAPLQGAILDFGNGAATATTDANGAFRVELPKPAQDPAQVQVKITHHGKILKDEKLWQTAKVLGELKVLR
jgi:hypothetical protein